jgi:hypothetical protein
MEMDKNVFIVLDAIGDGFRKDLAQFQQRKN